MNSPIPLVSAFTAGILILIQVWLMLAVIRLRRRNRQPLGDGGNVDLNRAIRRHGNFAENAAIFVAGFALLELLGANRMLLAGICTTFVVGRLSHAIGFSMKSEVNPWRTTGTFLTVLVGVALAWRLIATAVPQLML